MRPAPVGTPTLPDLIPEGNLRSRVLDFSERQCVLTVTRRPLPGNATPRGCVPSAAKVPGNHVRGGVTDIGVSGYVRSTGLTVTAV